MGVNEHEKLSNITQIKGTPAVERYSLVQAFVS